MTVTRADGRDGRSVIKTLIRVSDLDRAFGLAAHAEHVQRIREAAPPLTREQTKFIAQVFSDHLLEQDAKRRREAEAGTASEAMSCPSSMAAASRAHGRGCPILASTGPLAY
ncbi:hypothetical protein GCM10025862_12630 [Arsenicicoccus piscis]|uniref:Uncharacterized protein n=1 Tax=Arsenicicoccus piscis TaxID=673954 RepID=A0ABQ6HLL2_9MICO|nr:hypothetical protein GCM10025862_12630 [Arsenicicoccus piscis]